MMPPTAHQTSYHTYRRKRSGFAGFLIFGIVFFLIFGIGYFDIYIPIDVFSRITIFPTIFWILIIGGIIRIARLRSYRHRRSYFRQPPANSTPSPPSPWPLMQSTTHQNASYSNQPKPQEETNSNYCPSCGSLQENELNNYCSHCGEHIRH